MPPVDPIDPTALLEAAPAALLQVAADGRLAWANAAARALCGGAATTGVPAAALWCDPPAAAALWRGGGARVELALAGDTTRRVVAESRALGTGGGWALALQPLDAADRVARRADEAARRLELVTRTAGIGYWTLEPGAERATWSDRLRELFVLPPGAPPPRRADWLHEHVHPEDRDEVARRFAHWNGSMEGALELNFRIQRPDGSVRHVASHTRAERGGDGDGSGGGEPLLFGICIDLTERRSAEIAWRSAAERVALAARGAGVGTWEIDRETGEVFWDEQMWLLRGLAPQPRPMSVAEREACVHPDDREATLAAQARAIAGRLPYSGEFRVVWPDGQVRWLASRSAELRDEATGAARRIGVNWDVTDARTADAVRQQREIALRESQGKSRFLARMSHELRTPLNAVLGFSQLLLADEQGGDAAAGARRRRLEHIRGAGQHLLTLINDVLDLSSLEGGELRIASQPVALAPVVAQTLPLLGTLRDTLRIDVRLGPLDAVVMADATRLRQVLLNLLTNAVKYNRPGGEVTVEAQPRGDTVLIRVADTGRGMNDEQLRHLFEPFNRLGRDETIEGSGIGLAIVKALTEGMGGSVHVDSRVGVGSVFELRLRAADAAAAAAATVPAGAAAAPAAPATTEPERATTATTREAEPAITAATASATTAAPATRRSAAPSAPPPRRADGRRRVLYVEDNPVNALIIGELLARRRDVALEVAVDGASGVARAAALKPDLILLDMQLPDFDGFEVLRRLRAEPATAAIPCIALSANAMPADIERALRAGVCDYWTKPLDFQVFMSSLDTLFGKAC